MSRRNRNFVYDSTLRFSPYHYDPDAQRYGITDSVFYGTRRGALRCVKRMQPMLRAAGITVRVIPGWVDSYTSTYKCRIPKGPTL